MVSKKDIAAFKAAFAELEQDGKRDRWRRDPVAWVEERLGEHVWSKQAEALRSVAAHKLTAVQSSHGVGKALAVDTPLPTPSGWTTMGKVQPGDQLFDELGNPCTVVAVSPEWDDRPCYAVHVDDGDVIIADAAHEWAVVNSGRRIRNRTCVVDWRDRWDLAETLDTVELSRRRHLGNSSSSNFSIPMTWRLNLPDQDLPLPPYVLGAWLGDGGKDSATMTTCDPWMLEEFARQGMVVTPRKARTKDRTVEFGFQPDQGVAHIPACSGQGRPLLREIGVLGNKHIPDRYLRASAIQRLELLRGLMDTDGFPLERGNVGIEQRDHALAAGVVELARSLGWRAHMTRQSRPHPNRPGEIYWYWHVNFRPGVTPFKLPRKAAVFAERLCWDRRFTHRTVVRVDPVENQTTRCVEVDSPSHLFLAGRGMVPTHNSHIASRLIGYYLDNYPPGDFFVISTAPTWAQVRAIIWRYAAQMAAKHDLPGYVTQNAEWKIGNELVAFGRKPADQNQQGLQGLHANRGVIAIIDEASGVQDQIWNAVDSLTTTPESKIIALGNPDAVSSRFFRVCTTEPGWNRIKICSFDTPAFTGESVPEDMFRGLVQREWVQDKAIRWGTSSALYKIKVLGEFAEVDEFAVIPLGWVRLAQQRWLDYQELSLEEKQLHGPKGRIVLGVDVGHMGEDKTCIVTRHGHVVNQVETWAKKDTTQVASFVKDRLGGQSIAVVDSIGVGAGVVDQLRNSSHKVVPFIASATTRRRDVTGTQGFTNLRAAAWWNLRELLDPAMDGRLCLPPDDDLAADLSTPRYEMVHGGRIKIESKDDIRKRLGRSTDQADALVMAYFVEQYEREYPDGRISLKRPIPYTHTGPGAWVH